MVTLVSKSINAEVRVEGVINSLPASVQGREGNKEVQGIRVVNMEIEVIVYGNKEVPVSPRTNKEVWGDSGRIKT